MDRLDDRTTPPERKLSVAGAADALGISAEAVRSRVKRGTLRSVKEGANVYVLLPTDQTRPDTDQATPEPDRTDARSPSDAEAIISAKDETIGVLKAQLEAEREAHAAERHAHAEARRAHAEAQRIILSMADAMKALNPPVPQEALEAQEWPAGTQPTQAPDQARSEPNNAPTAAQATTPRRPNRLWRWFFGE